MGSHPTSYAALRVVLGWVAARGLDVARIAERRNALTASDDLKTAATSGCKTTADVSASFDANRFGLAFE